MLSNTSVDKVFMHRFEKMSSASGGFAPVPHREAAPGPCWGTSVPQTPSLPTPEKSLRAPMLELVVRCRCRKLSQQKCVLHV